MKLLAIFRFELAYQVRRAWPWLIFAVVFVLSFMMARDQSLADAMYQDFFANSPFAVAKTTVIGGLVWLLAAAVVAGEAGARDVATGMYALIYTSPVSKGEYLGGRFLAAFVLNTCILLAVQAGTLVAVYAPGVDPQVIGPFRPAAFLTAYAYVALPNAFAATAIQFLLAVRSGRAMTAYPGSVFLVFMGFFVATLLNYFVRRGLGTLLDPIGIYFIVEELARLWTTAEKSTRLLELQGTFLMNRLIWVAVGLGALAFTYARFQFAHRAEGSWWSRLTRRKAHAPTPADIVVTASASISVPQVWRSFGLALHTRRTLAIAWISFRAIAKSWAGRALLVGIPILTMLVVIAQMDSLGTPLVPTTVRVLREMTGGLSAGIASEPSRWVIIPLLIVFFAGELVWRERDAGLGEITDTMPVPAWVLFLGKYFGLALVLVVFLGVQMAAGMLAQTMLGYHAFAIGLYLEVLFGLQLPEYLLFAMLALVVHVVVDQKYVGYLVAILAYAFIAVLAAMLGIEHHLLVYGSSPAWSYTDMRGFGVTLGPWVWFKLYWAAWAVLLAVAAPLLLVRGNERGLSVRLAEARRRVTRATVTMTAIGLVLIVSLGGFIFYNTNVLNRYASSAEVAERRAEYERRYGRYENVPQPRVTGANVRVEIYPGRRAVDITGSYRLVNRSAQAIDSIHVATSTSAETRAMTFSRAATLALGDEAHGHRIYALARPLQPGDSVRLDFDVRVARRGFSNRGADPAVQRNGSYFTNEAWFPAVGYQRMRGLLGPAERREHGLPPRPVLASLSSEQEGNDAAVRGGEGIAFDAVVGTDEGQVAVAPGALRRTWTEGGRRYFHYSTDAPIADEWGFFSADYAVREEHADGVAIRIFHDPSHTVHLEGMISSTRASLDYYRAQLGAYPYHHLTIVERPGSTGMGMHAEPSMIYYSEGVAFWSSRTGQRSFDFPYAVMGHEMAHQWALPYAMVEGLPFLAEGLAWYFGMNMVRESRGDWQFRRLMQFMRLPYPHAPIRRGEPLLRALDPYQAYRKGPFAMYALSEYVGQDRVNGVLRRLFQKHNSPGASQATTLDLYRELQAVTPDSLKPLLHDLFEVNTFWDLKVERVVAEQQADGTWQVTLEVRARKTAYDTAGVETDVPMDDWVEIGVFGEGERGDELGRPLHLEKHRIRSGEQTITITVSGRPVLTGIDPFHVLDWDEGEDDDNIERVNPPAPHRLRDAPDSARVARRTGRSVSSRTS
jgi:ABC-2 type transport system permease protein